MGVFGNEPGQIPAMTQARELSTSTSVPFWDEGFTPDEFDSPSAWDTLIIGDDRLPGVAKVDGARQIKVDERDAPGSDGKTLTFLGRDSSQIMVKLQIWTQSQLDRWAEIVPKIQPPPGRAPASPFDVYHPGLAILRIKSLYVLDTGVLAPTGKPGIFETQLRFVEFLPAKKVKLSTPTGSLGSGKKSPLGSGKPQAIPRPSEGEGHP